MKSEQRHRAEIKARDRRNAATHEAGHITVANHFGVSAAAFIQPLRGLDEPIQYVRTWIGKIGFLSPAPPAKRLLVAIAGELATMRERSADDYFMALEWGTWDQPTAMSESDWRHAGYEPGQVDEKFMRAVKRVDKILDLPRNRERLRYVTRQLMRAKVDDDGGRTLSYFHPPRRAS